MRARFESRLRQEGLPVGGDPSGRPGHTLVEGMVLGWGEAGPFQVLAGPIVPEPVLPRLEAADDRVTGRLRMRGRVLAQRIVATSDVPALRAPSEVEPPATGLETLHAAGPAWRDLWIDGARHGGTSCYECVDGREER